MNARAQSLSVENWDFQPHQIPSVRGRRRPGKVKAKDLRTGKWENTGHGMQKIS